MVVDEHNFKFTILNQDVNDFLIFQGEVIYSLGDQVMLRDLQIHNSCAD